MDARRLPEDIQALIKRYNSRLKGRPIVLDDLDADELQLVQECTLAVVMKMGAHEGSILELYPKIRTVVAVAVREAGRLRAKKRRGS